MSATITTGTNNVTYTLPPCDCGHLRENHGVICDDPKWEDATPVCWDCVGEPWCKDEETCKPAFHTFTVSARTAESREEDR